MAERLSIDLHPELVEQLAERVAELLVDRASEPDPWLTVAEAAEHLRCTTSRLYSLVSARRIPFHKDGSRTLFRRGELDEWVRQGGASCPC